MILSPAQRAQIRARAEQAMKGPWRQGPHYRTDVESRYGRIAETSLVRGPQAELDAEFIAAARADVPDLLDTLDASEARVKELEAVLTQISEHDGERHRIVDECLFAKPTPQEIALSVLSEERTPKP